MDHAEDTLVICPALQKSGSHLQRHAAPLMTQNHNHDPNPQYGFSTPEPHASLLRHCSVSSPWENEKICSAPSHVSASRNLYRQAQETSKIHSPNTVFVPMDDMDDHNHSTVQLGGSPFRNAVVWGADHQNNNITHYQRSHNSSPLTTTSTSDNMSSSFRTLTDFDATVQELDMTMVNESSTFCQEAHDIPHEDEEEETQIMTPVSNEQDMSPQLSRDIHVIQKRAALDCESRKRAIHAGSSRLGVMKRVANPVGHKRAYRYKFQEGAAYTAMGTRQRQLEQRLAQLQQHPSSNHSNVQAAMHTTSVMLASVREELLRMKKERMEHVHVSHALMLEQESPFQDYPVLAQRYVLCQLLGRGGFCEVWKVYDVVRRVYVAAKFHTQSDAAYAEFRIQSPLRHPNIVGILDELIVGTGPVFSGYYVLIMEFVESNLAQHLKMHGKLNEVEAKDIVCQILEALAYMNSPDHVHERITHYDLKPQNVLLTSNGTVKLADFGLSKFSSTSALQIGLAGTYWYLPPEVFRHTEGILVNSKIDTWSVGVLFYELVCGQRPFGHKMTQQRVLEEQVILKASSVVFPPDAHHLSRETLGLIQMCLTYDQSLRPSIRNLAGLTD